jgi:hypothetical protein
VDESEELARLFASDIGHGLLGQMYETLLEQNEKAQSGLAVLKAAAKIFAGK